MESLHTHKGTEHNPPPPPCFCSLQKWAVKDQQYCFLWEEGKGSQMQIFLCGGEGDKTSPRPKKPPLGFRHVLGDNSQAHFFLSSTLTTFLCSQFALFHLPVSKTLLSKSSEVQLPEIQGAAVILWYFLRLAVFYFSIKKVTFKISKSLNIDHEEQTVFQVSCTFPQKPEVGQISCLLCEQKIDNISANTGLISQGKTEHQMSG